ncbi:hypothetical protein PVK06_019753 [Gossypium arboreum]|uniref:Uncharacterized protein n=1 Tax=Gossypium arboreum TaxID=29729 RepID=A0ABR0PKK1_GOSAR|nr:hypothetical protein PVK06_019753 [Gossypium arboreum]
MRVKEKKKMMMMTVMLASCVTDEADEYMSWGKNKKGVAAYIFNFSWEQCIAIGEYLRAWGLHCPAFPRMAWGRQSQRYDIILQGFSLSVFHYRAERKI